MVRTEDRIRGGRLDGLAQACRMHREVGGASPPGAPGSGPPGAPGSGPPGAPGSGAQGAVRTFGFSRDAPAAARHFAVGALRRWGIADLVDDVALVVTELAANAVRHARSGFTVILSSRPSRPDVVRISVRDADPLPSAGVSGTGSALPIAPLHGLGAVTAMASHWGVESLGSSGKTVWVELRA